MKSEEVLEPSWRRKECHGVRASCGLKRHYCLWHALFIIIMRLHSFIAGLCCSIRLSKRGSISLVKARCGFNLVEMFLMMWRRSIVNNMKTFMPQHFSLISTELSKNNSEWTIIDECSSQSCTKTHTCIFCRAIE